MILASETPFVENLSDSFFAEMMHLERILDVWFIIVISELYQAFSSMNIAICRKSYFIVAQNMDIIVASNCIESRSQNSSCKLCFSNSI